MDLILGLTDQPKQTLSVVIDDGTRAEIAFAYYPQQRGWFYDLTWQDFRVNGNRLIPAPNILGQFENLIPFGLMVLTTGSVEVLNQGDLVSGVCQIYLLNQADIAEVNAAAYPSRTP